MEVREAVVRFGYRAVLRKASLRLEPGEGVGLVGENGAGKTTLLRAMALLLRLDEGAVLVDGRPVGVEEVALRRRIAYLGHDPGLYPQETGREHLTFAARLHDLDVDVAAWLERAGLRHAGDERCQTYSRGMRQRLALCRALMGDPEFLLLDEPFTALDPAGRRWLVEELEGRRRRGRSHVVVSHEAHHLAPVVDRIVRLERGKVVAASAP